ncbi:MAG: hypothetical protein D3923_19440 [Candidatus Electrothrix sp. AR3]|nr:hypothetical protein [Candidatus Electrothrix sp. AR3]
MISPYIYSDFPLICILVNKSEKSCPLITFSFLLSILSDIITSIMDSKVKFIPNPNFKLMDQVHETLMYHHYARKNDPYSIE